MKKSHIITENPYEKEAAILELEGSKCRSCFSKKVKAIREPDGASFRNHYFCQDCGTQWYGNTYKTLTFEEEKENPFEKFYGIICMIVVLFLFLLFFLPFFAFTMTFTALCLGVFSAWKLKEGSLFLKIALVMLFACVLRTFFM